MDDCNHWPECETCTRTFRTQRACNQHMNDLDHWAPVFECETCIREFRSQMAANQHMTAVGHWTPKIPCETCGKKFHTQNAADQHMNDLGHWAPKIPCETCNLKFRTHNAANQHMEKHAHYKAYCKDCGVRFQNENNLKMVRLPKPGCVFNAYKPNYSTSTQRFTAAPTSHAPSARTNTRPPVASLTTSRQVHALVPLGLIVIVYSVWFASVTRTVPLPRSRLNGTRTKTSNTQLPSVHSTALIGSAICATTISTPSML